MKIINRVFTSIASISLVLFIAFAYEKHYTPAIILFVVCVISSAILGKLDKNKNLKSLQDKPSLNNNNNLIKMENGNENQTEKDLTVTKSQDLKDKVKDVQIVGNPDAWVLICKASSQDLGWMKSTKAMQVLSGVIVQVTTQQKNNDGTYAIADAITFCKGVKIGKGKEEGTFILQ